MRTNFCFFYLMVRSITHIVSSINYGKTRTDIEEQECIEVTTKASEIPKSFEEYAGITLICANLSKLILMLIALKKPGTCRLYLYYQILLIALERTITPIAAY